MVDVSIPTEDLSACVTRALYRVRTKLTVSVSDMYSQLVLFLLFHFIFSPRWTPRFMLYPKIASRIL